MATVRHVPLGYNDIYVVDDGGARILVDTGPDYRGAAEAIDMALDSRLPAIVVATHGHLDHAGLGRHWKERGIAVGLGAADVHLTCEPQLSDPEELRSFEDYVHSAGTPGDVANEVIAALRRRRDWAIEAAQGNQHLASGDGRWPTQLRYRHFQPDRLLLDGDRISGTELQVLHCPGHTPGNIVLYEPHEGWLFSGDQLLPGITPTPAIQISPEPGPVHHWRFPSLPRFVDSMHRLRDLEITRCFPGHGEPFGAVRDVIDVNLAQIEQRTEKVLAAVHRHGETTIYGLASDLYPRAIRRRYWQIVATVQGHLDILVERDLVTGKGDCYRPAG